MSTVLLISCKRDNQKIDITHTHLESCASVIDQGHGGYDPGTWAIFRFDTAYEDTYANDISLRLNRRLKEMGCITKLTMRGDTVIRDYVPQKILPNWPLEVLTDIDSIPTSESWWLVERPLIGARFYNTHPAKNYFWTSIHIDELHDGQDSVAGVRIIYAPGAEEYANALKTTFGDIGALRRKDPVVPNGDPSIDKRLLVLKGTLNPIRQKVLIETMNMRSETDFARLRNPVIREAYAIAIAKAQAIVVKNHQK